MSQWEYRVILLEGDAKEREQTLDEVAYFDWILVTIDNNFAYFRREVDLNPGPMSVWDRRNYED